MHTVSRFHFETLVAKVRLPERVVLEAAKRPAFRDVLTSSGHLTQGTWELLARTEDFTGVLTRYANITYLTNNINRTRATWLARHFAQFRFSEKSSSQNLRNDLDRAIAKAFEKVEVNVAEARCVIRAELPCASLALLRQEHLPLDVRLKLAEQVYRAERLAFLASTVCDGLSDDEVWRLATAPDKLENFARSSSLGDKLLVREVENGADLLANRPGLLDLALWSGSPSWLMAASCVPLTPSQQEILCEEFQVVWPREEEWTSQYQKNPSRYGSGRNVTPITNLAATPWCTREVLENIASEDPRFDLASGSVIFSDPNYSYSQDRIRPSLEVVDLGDAPSSVVESWLTTYSAQNLPSHPFVVLSSAPNQKLGPVASQRRDILRIVARQIPSSIRRVKRLKLNLPKVKEERYWGESETQQTHALTNLEDRFPGVTAAHDLLVGASPEELTTLLDQLGGKISAT